MSKIIKLFPTTETVNLMLQVNITFKISKKLEPDMKDIIFNATGNTIRELTEVGATEVQADITCCEAIDAANDIG